MRLSKKPTSVVKTSRLSSVPLRTTFSESKGVQILSGVLVLQLAVAAGLFWKSSLQADFEPATQLVDVDPSTVDEIIIDDGEGRISLTSVDDQWHMDDQHETLASADRISLLVSTIAELNPGLPVANTAGSHQQLEVGEDDFQRHVTLKAKGEAVADLYIGTSPGYRKSHVRRVDQDQVYAVEMNTFDVPASHDDWLDRNLLAFDSVNGVKTEAVEVAFADEQWAIVKPEDKAETHEVDRNGIASLVSRLASLRVDGFATPLGTDEPADAITASDESDEAEVEELLTHSITIVNNDTPVTLLLSREGSDATIERSDVKGLFALPISTYEGLTNEVIQQLLVERGAETEEADSPQG